MKEIIEAALVAVVAGLSFAFVLSVWERWGRRADVEYDEGRKDAAAGRYMRRDSTIDYRRGYMHVCRAEHKHHWRGKVRT